MHKQVKRSARADRGAWLTELAGSGSWRALRQLRKGTNRKQGQLKSLNGQLVESDARADTFAKYLEQVQWAVRPALVLDTPPLQLLDVKGEPITLAELHSATKRLRSNKACGPDGQPVEFWKVVLDAGGIGAQWLLRFCNKIWESQCVPQSWHLQEVALIFKKGDPADCGNYRPICLLNAAYKIFAMILLQRLLAAGADDKLWPSQFGFRKHRSTEHALHCIRRSVEQAWAHRNGQLHVLALDWRKCFDSINTDAMLAALQRFGIPCNILCIIRSIYTGRLFQVNECGKASAKHRQDSGICQGCPLSPFLFIIVMSVLMTDAHSMLSKGATEAISRGDLSDLLYADDTLVMGVSAAHVGELAAAIEQVGSRYGMVLHWGKTQAISVCSDDHIRRPDGSPILGSGSLEYLGALITSDGRADSELSRRLGMAAGDFRELRKLWGNSGVTLKSKLHFFESLITSRLTYGLATMWLVTAQRRRLDGFYARCLRKILRIPHAFYSRISNATVLKRAGVAPLSQQLSYRQLALLGTVARSSPEGCLRRSTFVNSTTSPQIGRYIRRVGRPRQAWTTQVMKEGVRLFGEVQFERMLGDRSPGAEQMWKEKLRGLVSKSP